MKSRRRAFDVLVTVASWEPRFVLGLKRTLQEYSARRILAYFIGEYGDRTEEARHALRKILKKHPGVALKEQEITFGTPQVPRGECWRKTSDRPPELEKQCWSTLRPCPAK